jgi:hypothetical protein
MHTNLTNSYKLNEVLYHETYRNQLSCSELTNIENYLLNKTLISFSPSHLRKLKAKG